MDQVVGQALATFRRIETQVPKRSRTAVGEAAVHLAPALYDVP
jgi:hypothetical protein